jgi:plasmid stability protein
MTLTLPRELGDALKARAAAEGRSVEEIVLDAIGKALGLDAAPIKRDLSFLQMDETTAKAIEEVRAWHEQINEASWR